MSRTRVSPRITRRGTAFVAALALAAGLAAWGCGSKFELPTERKVGREIPSDKSYQMLATWSGFVGVQDLLLTPAPGEQLFVLFNRGGSGTAKAKIAHRQIIQAFLNRKVRPTLEDHHGNTVLDWARTDWIRALIS